ncbi:hypothetical protein [Pseudomonas yamanorum]|uniref:hypothetical protein n=1 Tax=Pseudomonas yamanorum TaxID=515393 RepID=UPI003D35ADAE
MNKELMEDEMRRALFGYVEVHVPVSTSGTQKTLSDIEIVSPVNAVTKNRASKTITPRIRVTLQVGNEFEGKTFELIHEVNTLSTLLAEQDATKTAKKKFKFVKVISVKSI